MAILQIFSLICWYCKPSVQFNYTKFNRRISSQNCPPVSNNDEPDNLTVDSGVNLYLLHTAEKSQFVTTKSALILTTPKIRTEILLVNSSQCIPKATFIQKKCVKESRHSTRHLYFVKPIFWKINRTGMRKKMKQILEAHCAWNLQTGSVQCS